VEAIRTVGHGTLEADAFGDLVRAAGIEVVVDVRRYPGSRRLPQFGSDAMQTWLAERDVGYEWLEPLGGRRNPVPDTVNVALRNAQFRGYADHMASEAFASGVAELLSVATRRPATVMCAESVWWRCHRRLLADHLVLVEDLRVEHLFHDGRLVVHTPTPEARRVDDHVVYDIVSQPSLLDE
jgi:uncharacterized protein (DUF488 family)